MRDPLIFLTNDDGIESPGLRAAVEAVAAFGELIVVAPSRQQTGMGRSLSGHPEARLQPFDFKIAGSRIRAFHCDCTPAMTVHLGVLALCAGRKPDLLISGINYGENIGTGVTASGTVGAALQGADMGIASLAVSKQTDVGSYHEYTEQDWQTAKHYVSVFARKMLERSLPDTVDVLKIDVPQEATPETDWRLTTLSRQKYWNLYLENPGEQSKIGDVKISIDIDPAEIDPKSDIYAVIVEKMVSVTPLSLDFTTRVEFGRIESSLTEQAKN